MWRRIGSASLSPETGWPRLEARDGHTGCDSSRPQSVKVDTISFVLFSVAKGVGFLGAIGHFHYGDCTVDMIKRPQGQQIKVLCRV